MPLYFFHLTDSVFNPDQEGTELPNLDSARVEAIRFAAATAMELPNKVRDGSGLRVEVSDDAGLGLCTVIIRAIDAPASRGWTERPEGTGMG